MNGPTDETAYDDPARVVGDPIGHDEDCGGQPCNCPPTDEHVSVHPRSTGLAAADRRAPPRWRDYLTLLTAVLVIKFVVLGWGVVQAQPDKFSHDDYRNNYHHHRIIGRSMDPPRFDFYELWGTSDAQWYYAIAESGYPSLDEFDRVDGDSRPKLIAQVDTQNMYAFFPLWPLIIRVVAACGLDLYAAAFVGANLISLAMAMALFGFLAIRAGTRAAFWTVVFMMASPFAIFFHVPFTEGLFALLAIGVFVASERRWWFAAGLCIGLATVTRPTGLALMSVPVTCHIVDAIRDKRWSWPQSTRLLWLLVAFVPLGIMLWHHNVKTGDALYFLKATHWWGYDQSTMWQNVWRNTYQAATAFPELPMHGFHHSQIDCVVLALSTVTLLIGLRTVPLHYVAYAGAVILIPLVTKDLMSFSRYALVAWPLFHIPVAVVGEAHRRWVFGVLTVLMIPMQMIAIDEFVNWHWVA